MGIIKGGKILIHLALIFTWQQECQAACAVGWGSGREGSEVQLCPWTGPVHYVWWLLMSFQATCELIPVIGKLFVIYITYVATMPSYPC